MGKIFYPFSTAGRIPRLSFWKLIIAAALPWLAIALANDLAIYTGVGRLDAIPRDWVLGLFAVTG